ncbi:MAG: (2Fe-2S) ferredoxin domain-containing protein [Spirochaetes bacterium]|nr:(2Fe-2S) ferredoxin domain-containing protein [Spirochaetota bacterium]
MPKLTVEDLKKIKEKVQATTTLREGNQRVKITVHMGTCGITAGARGIMNILLSEIENRNISDIILTSSGCAGFCSHEPMATVEVIGEAPVKYIDLNEEKILRIFEEHVLNGKIVEEYALAIGSETAY